MKFNRISSSPPTDIGHVPQWYWDKGSLRHHVDELLLRRKRQDLKSDRCLDQGIVAFVVLNTKLDAMHDDLMSRVVDDRRQQDSKFDQFGQADGSLVVSAR